MKPAVVIQCLPGFLRILEITFEDVGALNTNFTTAICSIVIHFWHVNEFNSAASKRRSNMFCSIIALKQKVKIKVTILQTKKCYVDYVNGESCWGSTFGKPVAFNDDAAQGTAHEIQNSSSQRC